MSIANRVLLRRLRASAGLFECRECVAQFAFGRLAAGIFAPPNCCPVCGSAQVASVDTTARGK